MINLKLNLIKDVPTREAFNTLLRHFESQEFLKGQWTYVEVTFDKATESFRFNHNLGFVPKDFIQTYLTGTGAIYINWHLTDRQFLDMTATAPCTVRGFVGAHG